MVDLVTIWQAHGDSGSDMGTGPVFAHLRTEAAAKTAAKSRGWYGSDGQVSKATALVVDGQYWLLAHDKPIDIDSEQAKRDAALREKTLSSLNAEQLRVLGLTHNA
jgi:hypothetical protein